MGFPFSARRGALLGGIAALAFGLNAAAADNWPSRPITFIVPSSPGGGTDITARLLAEGVSRELKQSIVVDNKPGASGNIGAAATAKAAGDGYTFMVAATPSIAVNEYLYKNLPYNVETDLKPVARAFDSPLFWVVLANSPYKTLADMLEAGKRDPGKISFGSAGQGSPTYLGVKGIENKTGASFTHVPYKGMAASVQDFLGGRIQFLLSDPAMIKPYIESGKVRALATSVKSPLFPDLPVWTDKGLPGVPQSFSVMAPGTTPDAIVQAMSRAVNKVMQDPATEKRIIDLGFIPTIDTPAKFGAQLKDERAMWKSLIERNHITIE